MRKRIVIAQIWRVAADVADQEITIQEWKIAVDVTDQKITIQG